MNRERELERDRQIAQIQAMLGRPAGGPRSRGAGRVLDDDRIESRVDEPVDSADIADGLEADRPELADGERERIELHLDPHAEAPPLHRGARLLMQRRQAITFTVVAVLSAAVAALATWMTRPVATPAAAVPVASVVADVADDAQTSGGPPAAQPSSAGVPAASTSAAPALIVVSVVGKVAAPGLVTLPDGARVSDAIAAAGGALPDTDLTTINLARRVADGEQIAVGVPPAVDAAAPGGPGSSGSLGSSGSGGGPINLNMASESELDTLPGIGPVLAARIVEHRDENGPFGSVDELTDVSGVGPSIMEDIRDLVTV